MNYGKRFIAAVAAAVAVIVLSVGGLSEKLAAQTAAKPPVAEKGSAKKTTTKPVAQPKAPRDATKEKPATSERQVSRAGTLRLPLASPGQINLFPFQVAGTTPDGAIHLKLAESVRTYWSRKSDDFRRGIRENEGHCVALTNAPESDVPKLLFGLMDGSVSVEQMKLARAQVVELDKEGQAVIRVGAAATRQIKPGSVVFLLRPRPGLQAAPELLAISDGRSRAVMQLTMQLMKTLQASRPLRTSINNLKHIGVAMHNFHNVHHYFPPAVIYGPDGKPWHSWRVLLLPYLAHVQLYEQYRFDEPWDGPNNSKLIEQVPSHYRDLVYGDSKDGYTHYAVAVGRGTAFPPEGYKLHDKPSRTLLLPARLQGATTYADFKDGTSSSLHVGPVSPERKIPWTKPEDVVFDDHFPGLGKPGGFAAPYKTNQGAGGPFLYADSFVCTISEDIDSQVLCNLIQIADGHAIPMHLPSIPAPRGPEIPSAVPVLELRLDQPQPSARLVFEPMIEGFGSRGPAPRKHSASPPAGMPGHPGGAAAKWTCSMHPLIKLSRPGKCPICAMDLIRQAPK